MPRYKSGIYELKDPSGKIVSRHFLVQTKQAKKSMEREGFKFKRVKR